MVDFQLPQPIEAEGLQVDVWLRLDIRRQQSLHGLEVTRRRPIACALPLASKQTPGGACRY